jgi:hypothetical protein
MRISNLPATVTKEQLLTQLNIPSKFIERLKFPDQSVSNKPMVVYMVNQPSENLLRAKIREWHNIQFSPDVPNRIKCQLEWNMNYYDWDYRNHLSETLIRSRTSSSAFNSSSHIQSTVTKIAPWFNGKEETSSTSIQTEQSAGTNLRSAEMKKKAMSKTGFYQYSWF